MIPARFEMSVIEHSIHRSINARDYMYVTSLVNGCYVHPYIQICAYQLLEAEENAKIIDEIMEEPNMTWEPNMIRRNSRSWLSDVLWGDLHNEITKRERLKESQSKKRRLVSK